MWQAICSSLPTKRAATRLLPQRQPRPRAHGQGGKSRSESRRKPTPRTPTRNAARIRVGFAFGTQPPGRQRNVCARHALLTKTRRKPATGVWIPGRASRAHNNNLSVCLNGGCSGFRPNKYMSSLPKRQIEIEDEG